MKKIILLPIIFLFITCSPYKKIRITMSQLHTMNWQNKTEAEVISKFGQYKRKESLSQGYKIIFDYSTYIIPKKIAQANDYSIHVSNNSPIDNQGRMQQQRTEFTSSNNRTSSINQLQEIANLKTLEFFFDQNNKVNYVIANGFPDSIRYEIRKK
jgi:hypothetical protein